MATATSTSSSQKSFLDVVKTPVKCHSPKAVPHSKQAGIIQKPFSSPMGVLSPSYDHSAQTQWRSSLGLTAGAAGPLSPEVSPRSWSTSHSAVDIAHSGSEIAMDAFSVSSSEGSFLSSSPRTPDQSTLSDEKASGLLKTPRVLHCENSSPPVAKIAYKGILPTPPVFLGSAPCVSPLEPALQSPEVASPLSLGATAKKTGTGVFVPSRFPSNSSREAATSPAVLPTIPKVILGDIPERISNRLSTLLANSGKNYSEDEDSMYHCEFFKPVVFSPEEFVAVCRLMEQWGY